MIEIKISTRYAQALIDSATASDKLDTVRKDAGMLIDFLKGERKLLNVLRSPVIPKEIKYRLIERIFSDRINELTAKFMNLIIRKGRAEFFLDIFTRYIDLYNIKMRISNASLTTATNVDEKLLEKARSIVADYTNTTVNIENTINEKLIGGFILQFSDKKLDASVASNLKELQKALIQ